MTEAANQSATVLPLRTTPPMRRPGSIRLQFVLTSGKDGWRTVKRHWSAELHRTVPCSCDPRCESSRLDHFISGLIVYRLPQWEQAILHFTDQALVTLTNEMSIAGIEDFRGLAGVWERRGDQHTGRVSISSLQVSGVPVDPFDIDWALARRLNVSTAFFGKPLLELDGKPMEDDQVIPPARSRSDKPRVSKGCGPCHRPAKKKS